MRYLQGTESILYIKHLGVWAPISCENSHTFSENSENIGTTTRDNAGWKTSLPTEQSYSISAECTSTLENQTGILSYFEIRKKKRDRDLIEWKRESAGGDYVDTGFAYIFDISNVMSTGDQAKFSLTLTGFGKPDFRYENGVLVNFNDEAITDENNNAIYTE